jgi:catechol 2,3-dioxygenase-like lactoylglutathione lyase family enzyme
MERTIMTTLKINGLGVHIKVKDIQASRDFYEGLLGLKPAFAYGNPEFLKTIPEGVTAVPEEYQGVTYFPVENSPLEIADGHRAVSDPAAFSDPIPTAKVSAMIRVDSLLPLIEHAGLRPKFPVRHYYWGTIELALRDPDGWVIVLIAPYSEAEIESIRKFVPVEDVSPGV